MNSGNLPTNECKVFVRKLAIEYYLDNENVTKLDVLKMFKGVKLFYSTRNRCSYVKIEIISL